MEKYLSLEEKNRMILRDPNETEGNTKTYTIEAGYYDYNLDEKKWVWCVELLANSEYDAMIRAVVPRMVNDRDIQIINVFAGRNKWGMVE